MPKSDYLRAKEAEKNQETAITEALRLTSAQIFEVIKRDGEEELRRPTTSLIWSGIAAGILIAFSPIAMGIFRAHMPDQPWRPLIECIGYSFGFLLVILGRMQLFTENTITTILPMTDNPRRCGPQVVRLWSIVFAANMIGALIAAMVMVWAGAVRPDHLAAILDISAHVAEIPPLETLIRGIPAGILIAAIVWMLPTAGAAAFWVILLFTYLIALGGFTHVIAGAVEIFTLVVNGDIGLGAGVFGFILPALAGNVLGGTAVFTLMARRQVIAEV